MAFALTPEQSAVVNDRGGELLVSAAAGSGKTRVLVERLLSRVEDEGLDLDQFLVITFTKAAAAELRDKILAELNSRLAQRPDDWHLRRQITLIYRAQISTIHSFCTAFLRENSHLLDLDPDFRVADETEAELLRVRVLDRVLEERYEHLDENGFADLVDVLSAGRDDSRLRDITLDIHRRIQAHPDPARWLREQAAAFDLADVKDVGKTAWGQLLMEDAKSQTEYWRQQMVGTLDILQESGDDALIGAYAESINGTLDSLDDFLAALDRRWDSAQALCDIQFPTLGRSRKIQDKEAQNRVKAIRDKCKKSMAKLAKRFESGSRELLEDLEAVREPVNQLFRLVQDLQDAYGREKRKRRLLDFNDLEHFTVDALVQNGAPTALARRCQERFAEVMVDEYQDTNAVQNAIFYGLTDGGRTLFQVGDLKQSIYRFRLADPTIFLNKYHKFVPGGEAQPGQPRRLVLSRNFRSRKTVLDGVNFLFEHLMTAPFGEIDYTEDQRLNLGLLDQPPREDDRVELNVVDCSSLEMEEGQARPPRDQVEARFVARRVRQLLDEPYRVTEGDGFSPVRPDDIAILYRSPGAVLRYLTAALDEQDIPWQNEGGEDFFAATEVSVALSFLQIIDNPRQDVPLLSVLRSPVYGFTADDLARLRAAEPEGDIYACVAHGAEIGDPLCRRFLDDLAGLRVQMVDSSCAQLLWYLYDQMGLLALFGAMAGGQRRQENLLAFYDYARTFEGQGHRGVFAFVGHLRRLQEQDKNPVRAGSSGSGVRILSIHKSKGLEFPVVVLAGLARQFNRADETAPMLFHSQLGVGPKRLDPELRVEYPTLARTAVQLKLNKETKAEELRLLYVAMTRAREKLIMVMSFNEAEKELEKLLPDAGPNPEPEALFQLDSVGKWALLPVLARPDGEALRFGQRPGAYAKTIDHWDIQLIRAENSWLTDTLALRPAEPKTAAEQPDEAAVARQLRWRYPWQELTELPSKVTATQMKGRLLDEEAAEETARPLPPLAFRRPAFDQARRGLTAAQAGSAIHAVMEHINLNRADTVRGVRQELERLTAGGWLSPEQARAVDPAKVARFWASPLGREAAASPRLRREFKFSILAPAGRFYPAAGEGEEVLLQGVVDCCFTGPEGFTVVDFKSDHIRRGGELQRAEEYRGQLDVYTQALEEIFGQPVTRRVVWFFQTGQSAEL